LGLGDFIEIGLGVARLLSTRKHNKKQPNKQQTTTHTRWAPTIVISRVITPINGLTTG